MPIYEYQCQKCRKLHEVMQKMTEKPLTKCPDCGGKLKKMISNSSFVLKGTGWYATDYASDKNSSGAKGRKPAKSESPATSETKEGPKSEAAAEKKSEPAKAAAAD